MIIGRESDGTPIVLADVTTSTCVRMAYREARAEAEKMPTEALESWLRGYKAEVRSMNPINRVITKIGEMFNPSPHYTARMYVLKERRQKEPARTS